MIVFVAGFTSLEEDIGVLRGAADNRFFRTQGMLGIERIVNTFHHGAQVVVGQKFDFFDFVRGAETVKKVHKRYARTQG